MVLLSVFQLREAALHCPKTFLWSCSQHDYILRCTEHDIQLENCTATQEGRSILVLLTAHSAIKTTERDSWIPCPHLKPATASETQHGNNAGVRQETTPRSHRARFHSWKLSLLRIPSLDFNDYQNSEKGFHLLIIFSGVGSMEEEFVVSISSSYCTCLKFI